MKQACLTCFDCCFEIGDKVSFLFSNVRARMFVWCDLSDTGMERFFSELRDVLDRRECVDISTGVMWWGVGVGGCDCQDHHRPNGTGLGVRGESSSFVLIRKFLLPGSCMALAGDSLFFFPPSLFKRMTEWWSKYWGGKRDTTRQMSSIESHHACFCDIRGSFLHSPLLNPDKRFALDLFALLMSKSNIIHFTFYFWTIVGDGCRPRWANTDVWTAFDSEVQIHRTPSYCCCRWCCNYDGDDLHPKRFTECRCPHLRGITAVVSSCDSFFY